LSVLTKVLVVLVAIFSIVLVALVVPFVANQQNYQQQLEGEQSARQAAEAAARVAHSEVQAAQEKRDELVVQLQAQMQAGAAQINTLQRELAQAQSQVHGGSNELERLRADQSRLAAANQQLSAMLDSVRAELTDRRTRTVEMERRLIEATNQIHELNSQLETANVAVRRLREDVAGREQTLQDLQDRIAKLPPETRSLFAAAADVAAAPFVPENAIQGQVQRVEDMAGQAFVQLNIGRRDNVAENMKFIVYRDQQFLGTAVITLVDEGSSVARVLLQQNPIRQGDLVRTGAM
jgi:predicted  nucleic acid-binding Zn-ribbon protein